MHMMVGGMGVLVLVVLLLAAVIGWGGDRPGGGVRTDPP